MSRPKGVSTQAYGHARRTLMRLTKHWTLIEKKTDNIGTYGIVANNAVRGMLVIYSHAPYGEHEWIHVSVSKREVGQLPTWTEMMYAKNQFIGDDIEAYMIAPPKSRYVSIHPSCLHWWACYSEPEGLLPHFEEGIEGDMGFKSI
ncbi:MAG: hypothetical protein GY906_07840 [bacterium]|nr:hypothetical protein [bacterium]